MKDCLPVELESKADTAAVAEAGPVATLRDALGRRRLTINTVSSIVYYTLLMLVGLWYTPYMLHRVPESIYGLVPLATSLTSHLVIITTMITGPVCRYVTADLARGDVELANATFNSFVFGGAKLISLLGVLVLVFCAVLPVAVPPGHETIARLLFAAIGFSFLCSAMSSCFEVGYWVSHRFELRSLVETAVLLIRNGVVVLLFSFFEPDIWQIAVAAVIASLFQLSASYGAWKKLAPQLRVSRKAQTEERKQLIYSVGRWLMLGHAGNQLLLSTDLFLINRFFGTVENTKYGVLLLWATIIRSVFASLGLLLVPALVALEATQTTEDLVRLTARTIRLFGALAAHTSGILYGLSLPLLTIWIKKPWVDEIAPLTLFILLPLCFEICSIPLTSLLIAPERIARYGVSSFGFGVVAVAMATFLLSTTDLHFYAVAISFSVVTIIRNGLVQTALAVDGLNTQWYRFAILGVPLIARFAGSAAVAYLSAAWIHPTNVVSLLVCVVISVLLVVPVSFLGLPKEDRNIVLRYAMPGVA